jgi:glutamate dehydrogenase (NAD(P)+)
MTDIFALGDENGPLKVIHVNNPAVGLKGILVIDNIARGPAIGGLRMAPDVTVEECYRLARAMTLKNAAAGLRHGGGKSVMVGDPHMPRAEKERMIRAFACALEGERGYIFGPDMGTDEQCMAWVHDEIARAVGLPREIGGIPLDELGATAWGLRAAAVAAAGDAGIALKGARVAVQGFGSVGLHAARFFTELGCVLVAASDSRATVVNTGGLDLAALITHKAESGALAGFAGGESLGPDAVVGVDCDIWIPAARPDVLTEANIAGLKARLVLQGANIPATPEAEAEMHARGIVNVPDFIANAGGVICAAMEYAGATQAAAFAAIEEKVGENTRAVLDRAATRGIALRAAAEELAGERVAGAMANRRWSLM